MNAIDNNLLYSKTHEWVRNDGDEIATVGITDYAQSMLGDLVYLELPSAKKIVAAGDEIGVIESVKTAADVYTPLSGEIVEVNHALQQQTEHINKDPYGQGWLFKIKMSAPGELQKLQPAEQYQKQLETDSH